jgi:hypothetical protein
MYIHLYRNQPQGNAITGRLVIDGRWFCDTLERKGYQILPLCYHVAVTRSPKFKRLLPIVQNVPNRSGIRIHRGTKPEHSTGCILVVADNSQPLGCGLISPDGSNDRSAYVPQRNVVENNVVDVVVNSTPVFNPSPVVNPTPVGNPSPVGCRSAAEIERELTDLILKAQNTHEEIILEVTDFRPGTESGYNHPCPLELQQYTIDARSAEQRYLAALEAGLLRGDKS